MISINKNIMFELPEDDNFWEDFPLDDITNSTPKKPEPSVIPNSEPNSTQSKPSSEDFGCGNRGKRHLSNEENKNNKRTCIDTAGSNPFITDQHLVGLDASRKVLHNTAQDEHSTSFTALVHASPSKAPARKGKRKFPGPAGLLPKLPAGRSPDVLEVSAVRKEVKSPEQINMERNDMILSSQSGEEVFSDLPWQTLLRDLGDDGQKILQKYTLASSLYKARKKLLLKGKVAMVTCLIETIDWQGGDASVVLQDKSGRMHGTIHQDLMKDYQQHIQQGTALVLRQVSVISPTARNHYLNITPSNVVALYGKQDGKLFKTRFINQNKQLTDILMRTESEFIQEQQNKVLKDRTPLQISKQQQRAPGTNVMPQSTRFQPRTPSSGFPPRTPQLNTLNPRVSGVNTVSVPNTYKQKMSGANNVCQSNSFQTKTSQVNTFQGGTIQSRTTQPTQQRTPQSYTFHPRTPQSNILQPGTPQSNAFQQKTPQSNTFQQRTPQSNAFQQSQRTPQSNAFQQRTPQSNAFQQTTPQSSAFQQRTLQSNAFQQKTPQSIAFQQRTPQSNAFQQRTPQSNAFLPKTSHSNISGMRAPMNSASGCSYLSNRSQSETSDSIQECVSKSFTMNHDSVSNLETKVHQSATLNNSLRDKVMVNSVPVTKISPEQCNISKLSETPSKKTFRFKSASRTSIDPKAVSSAPDKVSAKYTKTDIVGVASTITDSSTRCNSHAAQSSDSFVKNTGTEKHVGMMSRPAWLEKKSVAYIQDDSDWNDDLSDELLSQFSEEML